MNFPSVYRAKPNPAGKDRSQGSPLGSQLVAEWVDLKNNGLRIKLGG